MTMRRLLLIILTAMMVSVGWGQTYHPIIRDSTYWDMLVVSSPQICTYTSGARLFFQGDTMIQGEHFNVIRGYPIISLIGSPYCPPYAVDTSISGIFYFLREDTAARKVYVRTLWGDYDLLYDFSLSAGDTVESQYAGGGNTLIVDSVTLDTLGNGEYRKFFHINNGFSSYIESIGGSMMSLGHPLCNFLGMGDYLQCVKEKGIDIWGFTCYFDILTTVQEFIDESASIFPNPTATFFSIQLPETFGTLGKLEIFNSVGQMVGRHETTENINISGYPSGLYFVVATDVSGERTIGRVVKE
jgi:hypothetical protein